MNQVDFSDIPGTHKLKSKRNCDERGFFEKLFDKSEFASKNLNTALDSIAISSNTMAGTLRGLHFQTAPHSEEKLVACLSGSIFDVVVDLRFDSPTFCKWASVLLDGDDEQVIYLPKGVAHGFQTLVDNSRVLYAITTTYNPASAYSLKYLDLTLNIDWPISVSVVSKKDAEGLSLAEAVDLFKDYE